MMKSITLIFLIFLISCSTQRSISETGIKTIRFGSGGGFTGAVTTYSLSSTGQIDKVDGEIKTSLKKIDEKKIKEIFEQGKGLITYTFSEPGNMSSFLEIQTNEKNNYITWGFGTTKVDSRVTILYNELMSLIKQNSN